jgi:hypothetical protein
VTELQPLKFTDSVNNIEFQIQGDAALDSKGFHYRGQLIEDAGEAHRLMVEFLKQNTQSQPKPVAPTDEELMDLWATTSYIDQPEGGLAYARAVLAHWGTPTNNTGGTH